MRFCKEAQAHTRLACANSTTSASAPHLRLHHAEKTGRGNHRAVYLPPPLPLSSPILANASATDIATAPASTLPTSNGISHLQPPMILPSPTAAGRRQRPSGSALPHSSTHARTKRRPAKMQIRPI